MNLATGHRDETSSIPDSHDSSLPDIGRTIPSRGATYENDGRQVADTPFTGLAGEPTVQSSHSDLTLRASLELSCRSFQSSAYCRNSWNSIHQIMTVERREPHTTTAAILLYYSATKSSDALVSNLPTRTCAYALKSGVSRNRPLL